MKVFALIFASACASSTQPRETTETPPSSETPHDPEAMAFCHRACQGQENSYPGTGYCTDGTYPHYKDCDAYIVCWDFGTYFINPSLGAPGQKCLHKRLFHYPDGFEN